MRKKAFIGSAMVLAAICLLLPVQCVADAKDGDAGPVRARLAGKWSGTVDQPEGETASYKMVMTLDPSGSGSIDYPDLKCGGTLTYIKTEGVYSFYRERITQGKEKCIDGGTVRLKKHGGKLEWYWYGGPVTARALLTSEKPVVKTGAQPVTCLSCTAVYERDNKACAMNISDLTLRAKCRDGAVNALRKCLAECKN